MSADERAERLLRKVMGRKRYKSFLWKDEIEIPSKMFRSRVYIIDADGNLFMKEHGRHERVFLCVDTLEDVPPGDHVATIYLYLTSDEASLLKVANEERKFSFKWQMHHLQYRLGENGVRYPKVWLWLMLLLMVGAPVGIWGVESLEIAGRAEKFLLALLKIASVGGAFCGMLFLADCLRFLRRLADRRIF